MLTRLILIHFCFLFTSALPAQYVIEGKLNMKGEWQNQIYLATVDRLDDYHSSNVEFVINVATIDTSGYFKMEGSNLPNPAQFYRLYLVKEEHSEFNACFFVGGEEHNFVHLILDNNSKLNIQADQSTYAPFGDYQITGDQDNQLMRALAKLVYPSYLFYEIKFPTELQFSQNKLNSDLFNFADTCSSPLTSLAALNMTDMDAFYNTNKKQYDDFADRLEQKINPHPYIHDYRWKLKYHQGDLEENPFWKILSLILAFLSIFLAYRLFRLSSTKRSVITPQDNQDILAICTPQELKILKYIKEGKSNKEIAQELFIEVSTVKTHINNLYSKLQVSNRKEAMLKFK